MPQSAPILPALGTGRAPRPCTGAPGGGDRSAARRALRALASALVMCLLVLLAPAAAQAQPDPEDFAGTARPLRLDALGPTTLAPGGTLSAEITITNTSSRTLVAPRLEVRTRTARVTERARLEQWQSQTAPDGSGEAVGTSSIAPDLAPGASAQVRVAIPAEELGYSDSPDLWGVRRLSFTLSSQDTALTSLRSFTVWRPAGASGQVRTSLLVPIAGADPSAQVTDPEAFTADATEGALARARDVALVDGVDWILDPALLDPVPVAPAAGGDEEATGTATPSADGGQPPALAPLPAASELSTALREGAGSRSVLSTPYAGADLVSLEEHGAEALLDRARTAGDDALTAAGVEPAARIIEVPAPQATGQEVMAAQAAGAQALVLPAASIPAAEQGPITPSSLALLESEAGTTPVIAPDTVLSAQLSALAPGSPDVTAARQRILAETAAIASQGAPTARHLVLLAEDPAALDPAAVQTVTTALDEAAWADPRPVGTLLETANSGGTTTDPYAEGGQLLSAGTIGPEELVADDAAEQRLDATSVERLQEASDRLDQLASVMEDRAPAQAAELLLLSAVSLDARGGGEAAAARAEQATARVEELAAGIEVVPVSEYTLVADAAGVPITVRNSLPTPITVQVDVRSDTHVVRIGRPQEVRVPARGSAQVTVPVEAIANGTVTLTTTLTTADGTPLVAPVEVPLRVNPAWENWTTMALVVAMGLLVVVGVLRARRTGSSRRAPGVKVPEDPTVLARTGRSQPAPVALEDPEPPAAPRPGAENAPQEDGR